MDVTFSPLPMKEAVRFWKDKVLLSHGAYRRLSDEARLRAFAVAGIAKGDELATVFAALGRAIEAGISYGEFKKEIREILSRRGWTGKRAWRVDNIFRTNIQTAYNVGRYRQMAKTARARPYWQYNAVNDTRTRPAHLALDGKVFPADHPFWDTWYPPNGFRCRCTVKSMTARQAAERGIKVETKDPTGGLIEPVDPKTGRRMPARLLIPDPGFATHPGKSFWGPVTDLLAQKAQTWPAGIGAAVLQEMASGQVFAAWYDKPEGVWPIAVIDDESARLIGAKSKTVMLSAGTAAKLASAHPELTAREYAFVQRAVLRGRRIKEGASLIYILEEPAGYVTVVKGTKSGESIFLTGFRRLSGRQAQSDREIRRLTRKNKQASGGASRSGFSGDEDKIE